MKIVELEQGSEEWHAWRKEGIGASDAGVLMEDDPYTTPYQLWEKKCGYAKPTPMTGPMKWGIQNEDKAREWINQHERLQLKPLCVEHEEHAFIRASLDGWDETQRILVEIKCPTTEATIDNARDHSAIHKYWYDQMQWQMLITRPERAYIALYDPRVKGCVILQQWPDGKLQAEMVRKAQEFWGRVISGDAPKLGDRDYKEVEDTSLEVLLREYSMADEQCKEGKRQKDALRDQIISFGEGDNFKAYGWAVRFCQGKKSYDYKKMEEDGIDLSKYERKGSPGYKITQLKGDR